MKNVCFVANYSVTELYSEIAKRLNANVFWIVVSDDIERNLNEHSEENRILRIKYYDKENVINNSLNIVYSDIVYGDRRLKYNPINGKKYLKRISIEILDFLNKNDIEVVFGEVTWAHEILIHRIQTKMRSKLYLIPHDVRIPRGEFTFFSDEFWSDQFRVDPSIRFKQITETDIIKNEDDNHIKATSNFVAKKSSFYYKLRYFYYFFIPLRDPCNPTYVGMRRSEKVRKNWMVPFSKFEWMCLPKKRVIDGQFKGKKIIGVPLHLQPEASIDNMARYFENQYSNIFDVARSVPEDYILLIKEHSIAEGRRNLGFYIRLAKIENVHFIKNKLTGPEFLQYCDVVFTLTGTMGLEAALLGKPVITFVPNQYTFLSNVTIISRLLLRKEYFWSELTDMDVEYIREQYDSFTADCYLGEINDPSLSDTVLSEANINLLVTAFGHIIKSIGS